MLLPAVTIIAIIITTCVNQLQCLGNKFHSKNVSSTLDSLLASNRYDKRIRPDFGGPPIEIAVNLFIKSIGPVSDDEQSFGLDCYFRQHWYDLRLKYDKLPGLDEFSMSWLFLDKVWKPDTYFVNGKKAYLHRITAPNKFLRLRYDGFITYSMRLTISASCPMYLRKFPLDAQTCPLILGSYGYTTKDVVYDWTSAKAVSIEKGLELAQFDLVNVTMENQKEHVRGQLKYSVLQSNFWLKRHTGYFMLQVYVPCGLIVVCSWVSFWIDPDAVPARVNLGAYLPGSQSIGFPLFQVYIPCGLIVLCSWVSFWIDQDDVMARVALGVTTVLSLTTMGFGGRAQLPKVSYWTALDWFVIICFTSVFSVMIEYACVNFIDKVTKDLKKIIEQKKKDKEELEQKTEPQPDSEVLSAANIRQRSVSFSAVESSILAAEEEPCRRVSEGGEPSRIPTDFKKSLLNISQQLPKLLEFPRRLSTTVREMIQKDKLKRSMENLSKLERGFRDADMSVPTVIVSDEDNAEDVVLEDGDEEWEDEVDLEKPVGEPSWCLRAKDFIQKLIDSCKEWKMLPQEVDVILLMADTQPDKFSKIDIGARRGFPLAFFGSLTVYLIAFAYYLTDEFPERDTSLDLYKN